MSKTLKQINRAKYYQDHKAHERELRRQYMKENPWLSHLYDAVKRCTNPKDSHYKYYGGRGIVCNLTVGDIATLWFRDKAYLMKKPSIDRKNNNGHYMVDNCQFIEHIENTGKAKRKQILQKTIFGVEYRIWDSIKQINEELGYDLSNLSEAIRDKRLCHGFKWEIYNG